MDDVKEKGINPVLPLGKDEPEPTSVQGVAAYPGYDRPVGRKFHRFPKVVPPSIRTAEDANVIRLSDAIRKKSSSSGGAA
jgi:hypothetical protein